LRLRLVSESDQRVCGHGRLACHSGSSALAMYILYMGPGSNCRSMIPGLPASGRGVVRTQLMDSATLDTNLNSINRGSFINQLEFDESYFHE
jgi:hypothetical protein